MRFSHLGKIDFSNTGSADIKEDFKTGVLLLDSFEYEKAWEFFQKVQMKEPSFTLAYLGKALTFNHSLWGSR